MLKLQYIRWRRPSWMEVRVTGHNFKNWPHKDHSCHVCFTLAYWFQRRRFLNIFPIGSYVKTMSADGGHLGWRSGSQDINLKVDHLRTIHVMFALNSAKNKNLVQHAQRVLARNHLGRCFFTVKCRWYVIKSP